MDSTFVSLPADSSGWVAFLTEKLPGIAPELAVLLAAALATRFVWLVRLLPTILKLLPAATVKQLGDGIQGIWKKAGWIINPVIMYLLGMQVTGGNGALSLLFTFAGIGVREWLIKSPLPTDRKALMKTKAAILFILVLLFIPVASNADTTEFMLEDTPASSVPLVPNWLSIAAGGGYTVNFMNDNQDTFPFIGVRLGYLQSARLKFEGSFNFVLDENHYTQATLATYIVF